MSKTGRNDPCPCGSGKKYKHCHLGSEISLDAASLQALSDPELLSEFEAFVESEHRKGNQRTPTLMEFAGKPNRATSLSHQMKDELDKHVFEDAEDLDRFIQEYQAIVNNRPLPEFWGLSPSQMRDILYGGKAGLEDFGRFDFEAAAKHLEESPLARHTDWLLSALVSAPVKLTSAGYLPPTLAQEGISRVLEGRPFWSHDYLGAQKKESDSPMMLDFRKMLTQAGWIKVRSGELSITAKGRAWLACTPAARLEALHDLLVFDLDWKRLDMYHSMQTHPFIQQSWGFQLWLLHKRAQDWVEPKELAKLWLAAFPSIPGDYGIDPAAKPRPGEDFSGFDDLTIMVTFVAFEFYPRLLGLVEYAPHVKGTPYSERLRVTTLFTKLFRPAAPPSTPEPPATP